MGTLRVQRKGKLLTLPLIGCILTNLLISMISKLIKLTNDSSGLVNR